MSSDVESSSLHHALDSICCSGEDYMAAVTKCDSMHFRQRVFAQEKGPPPPDYAANRQSEAAFGLNRMAKRYHCSDCPYTGTIFQIRQHLWDTQNRRGHFDYLEEDLLHLKEVDPPTPPSPTFPTPEMEPLLELWRSYLPHQLVQARDMVVNSWHELDFTYASVLPEVIFPCEARCDVVRCKSVLGSISDDHQWA